MTFTVIWLPDALNRLADVWTTYPNRAAVTAAADRIDARLAADPLAEGESRDEEDRVTFDPPLRVLVRVNVAAREVYVTELGVFGRRS